MSEPTQVIVTPENEGELLQAAADAVAEADGTKPVEEEEAAAESEATPEETKEPAKVESLEIQEQEQAAEEAVEAALDMDQLYSEYREKGELSEESRKSVTEALTKAGFANPDSVIDQYIAGAELQVQTMRNTAFETVGGEENYQAMIEWASDNLSEGEQQAFNQAVADQSLVDLAVRGLHARFVSANGEQQTTNRKVTPGATVTQGVAPVRSMEQIAELTADPRFDRDPGFRAEVEARIKASMDAGILK